MKKGIIDRFEGDIAVVEIDGENVDMPKASMPKGAKAGDALVMDGDKITIDVEATKALRKEIEQLMDELFE